MARQRHIPLRRCVACGTQRPQREFIRIVRTPEGRVAVNMGRTISGRGAYFCRSQACWERGLQRNRLEHVLRGRMSVEDRQSLQEFANNIVEQG